MHMSLSVALVTTRTFCKQIITSKRKKADHRLKG